MTTPRPKSYRLTWILVGVFLVLGIATAAYILTLRTAQAQARFQAQAQQEQLAQYQAEAFEELMVRNHAALLKLIETSPSLPDSLDTLQPAVAQWFASRRNLPVKGVFLLDREGNVLAEQPAALLQSLALSPHLLRPDASWLERGQSCQLIQGPDGFLAQQFVIIRSQGTWLGTLSVIIDIAEFFSRLETSTAAGSTLLALLDETGRIIFSPHPGVAGTDLPQLIPSATDRHMPFLQALARSQTYSGEILLPGTLTLPADAAAPEPSLVSLAPVRLRGQSWGILYGLSRSRLQLSPLTSLALHGCLLLIWTGAGLILLQAGRNRRYVRGIEQTLQEQSQSLDQSRDAVEDLHGRARQLLNNINDAMFLIAPEDGTLLDANRIAEQMLGYSSGELNQLSLKVLCPGRQYRRALKLVRTVRKDGHAEEPELQLRRKDGSQFISAIHARSSWLGNRKVIFCTLRDVTSSIKLAAELRRHNRQLSLLNDIAHRVTESQDLMAVLDVILDQVVNSLRVAGGGIYLLKHQGSEMQLMIHQNIPETVLADLRTLQPGQGLAGKVATSGRPRLSTNLQNDHRRISRAVAEDGWQAFLAVPLIADKTTHGVLFVYNRTAAMINREDIRLLQAIGRQVGPLVKNAELFDELQWQHRLNQATMRELERSRTSLRENLVKLEQHHRTLQSLDQMKSTFLALASHELRTPLTSIMSGSEFLEEAIAGQLGPEQTCALDAIRHGSRRLQQIVDDLLEAARLETQSLYLASEPFDPAVLLGKLLDDIRDRCRERRLDCRLEALPTGLSIRGDAHHLERAFNRLLENAIKFTPEHGWIRLSGAVRREAEVAQMSDRLRPFSSQFFEQPLAERYLEINLRDSGIGIAPEEQLQVFEKFYEVGDIASHSTSRDRFGGKGVGLGLTLAKGIVEAHAGMIWVESSGEDQGSCFSILLPLAAETDDANG